MTDFTLLPPDAPVPFPAEKNGLTAAVWQDASLRDALKECRIYRYVSGVLSVCGQRGVLSGSLPDAPSLSDFAQRMGLQTILRADETGEGQMLCAIGGGGGEFPPAADLRLCHAALCEAWGDEIPPFEDYYWRQMLERRRGVSEVYTLGGGFAALVKAPFGNRLHSVVTPAALRGNGAATALCRAIVAAAVGPVWVECAPTLTGFYENCGFIPAGRYTERI